ncbi:beta-L-arabinofuranosidase domain-containing protein [Chitinophaga sp. OAE865]|uniref:beta-L-arabinofuranosidase domain-containing protein n=1 Tax=Chitinophaga sp. OAE865 TaxID=2817898 RepID=UPI001AE75A80
MKPYTFTLLLLLFFPGISSIYAQQVNTAPYTFNRKPLRQDVYAQLPLGSIRAKGWLLKQLELQKNGFTGHAEELYPEKEDLGENSDWLGGSGNSWEKVPYYVKGLVALAYTLDDNTLKQKAEKWIDYTLSHQQEDGLFGPAKMKDWWPRMPFMYALQSYYEATNDKRVIPFLARYFRYQLAHLDSLPLDSWGKSRAADNMEIVLWTYNKTGQPYLLELVKKLKSQAYPWIDIFNNNRFFYYGDDYQPKHMVNVAQALKFPAVYSQLNTADNDEMAMWKGIRYIQRDNGQPTGLGSGTEFMSGKSTVQGVETCTVVEWMQSLETAGRIIHDSQVGDDLEKVAFNALPAQFDRDLKTHSYYTLPNQIKAAEGHHGYNQDYANGLLLSPYSGFPCCRYNLHMGWPYFIKNSCLATPDGGLAINTYGPMEINAMVAQNVPVKIYEDTNYPFEEQIRFSFDLKRSVAFPLRIRIPAWCEKPEVMVNGKLMRGVTSAAIFTINRTWENNDKIVLNFPMSVSIKKQVNNAVSIERGPLVYALKIVQSVTNKKEFDVKGFHETEILPRSAWNFGLVLDKRNTADQFRFVSNAMPENPFIAEQSPVQLKVHAKQIPSWTLDYSGNAAMDVPYSRVSSREQTQEITLVPFGSQNIRISVFPTIGEPEFINKLFEDNFNNNSADRWVIYGGGWFCKDDAVHCASNDQNSSGGVGSKIIATGTDFSDFTYSARITVNAPGNAGLIFRVSGPAIGADAYRGYYVGLNPVTGLVELGKANGKQYKVIAAAPQDIKLNVAYRVTVKARGDHFTVFINDDTNPLINAADQDYKCGSIGLRAYNALATMDKVEIKAF